MEARVQFPAGTLVKSFHRINICAKDPKFSLELQIDDKSKDEMWTRIYNIKLQ
jgi:hypothetical protein